MNIEANLKEHTRWGYCPRNERDVANGQRPGSRMRQLMAADKTAIKAIGMRARNHGYPNAQSAARVAMDIEDRAGVLMAVFPHPAI